MTPEDVRRSDTWAEWEENQKEAGIDPAPNTERKHGMKIKILFDGPVNGLDNKAINCKEGDVVETHDWYGQSLIDIDLAELVAEEAVEPADGTPDVQPMPDVLAEVIDEEVWTNLTEAGLGSVEALIEAEDDDIRAVKGIGKKTVERIRMALLAEAIDKPDVDETPDEQPMPDVLDEVIDEEVWTNLTEAGLGSVEALVEASDEDIRAVKGIGKKRVKDIRKALMAESVEPADKPGADADGEGDSEGSQASDDDDETENKD